MLFSERSSIFPSFAFFPIFPPTPKGVGENPSFFFQKKDQEKRTLVCRRKSQAILTANAEKKDRSFFSRNQTERQKISESRARKIILKYSLVKVLQKIANNVQSVYRGQGVEIYDQHIEVLISQMGSKIRIKEDFDSKFFWNEIVPLNLIKDNTEIQYEPIISGITRISLQTDSFISAASFQSTTKILSQESLKKSKDFLFGLKESIIINELIPSGTGIFITS